MLIQVHHRCNLTNPSIRVYSASWGKSTAEIILPSTNCIWLKAK